LSYDKKIIPSLISVVKDTQIMDMNRAFFLKKEARAPKWRLIDAEGKVLGRLASEVANILRGKDKATYTPHTESGDYVVIINAKKVKMTGDKLELKTYEHYTGWIGGLKTQTAKEVMARHPERIIEHAVKGMMPKNIISRHMMRKLKIYAGAAHPHQGQFTE